jgi:hypothetical protein
MDIACSSTWFLVVSSLSWAIMAFAAVIDARQELAPRSVERAYAVRSDARDAGVAVLESARAS